MSSFSSKRGESRWVTVTEDDKGWTNTSATQPPNPSRSDIWHILELRKQIQRQLELHVLRINAFEDQEDLWAVGKDMYKRMKKPHGSLSFESFWTNRVRLQSFSAEIMLKLTSRMIVEPR